MVQVNEESKVGKEITSNILMLTSAVGNLAGNTIIATSANAAKSAIELKDNLDSNSSNIDENKSANQNSLPDDIKMVMNAVYCFLYPVYLYIKYKKIETDFTKLVGKFIENKDITDASVELFKQLYPIIKDQKDSLIKNSTYIRTLIEDDHNAFFDLYPSVKSHLDSLLNIPGAISSYVHFGMFSSGQKLLEPKPLDIAYNYKIFTKEDLAKLTLLYKESKNSQLISYSSYESLQAIQNAENANDDHQRYAIFRTFYENNHSKNGRLYGILKDKFFSPWDSGAKPYANGEWEIPLNAETKMSMP